jgi:hypothetical protein
MNAEQKIYHHYILLLEYEISSVRIDHVVKDNVSIFFNALIGCSHLDLHEESLWSNYFDDKSASQVSTIILSRWYVLDISVILLGWNLCVKVT